MRQLQAQRRDSIAILILLVIGLLFLAVLLIMKVQNSDDAGDQERSASSSGVSADPNASGTKPEPGSAFDAGQRGSVGANDESATKGSEPPLTFAALNGPTKVVRRFQLGDLLESRLKEWEQVESDWDKQREFQRLLTQTLVHYSEDLLSVDKHDPQTFAALATDQRMTLRDLRFYYNELTKPQRSLHSLFLTNAYDGDLSLEQEEGDTLPKPVKNLVRVWTYQKEGLDPSLVTDVEFTLQYIIDTIGIPYPNGFDVVASAGLGTERFQVSLPFENVQGLYFISDEFAVVNAWLGEAQLNATIKHELVHAITYQLADDFESSRFISEGLAEYLRLLTPEFDPDSEEGEKAINTQVRKWIEAGEGEWSQENALKAKARTFLREQEIKQRGFDVSPEKIANELAALQTMFLRVPEMQTSLLNHGFKEVLTLPPNEFYGLRTFGYLLAQASMCYLDHKVVLHALKERSDKSIADALREVEWPDFWNWVQQHAKFGKPHKARVVTDRATQRGTKEHDRRWQRLPGVRDSLKGADLDPGDRYYSEDIVSGKKVDLLNAILNEEYSPPTSTSRSLRRVSDDVLSAGENDDLIVIIDRSQSLEDPFVLRNNDSDQFPELSKLDLSANDKQGFVNKFLSQVDRGKEGNRMVSVNFQREPLPMHPPIVLEQGERPSFFNIPAWLKRNQYNEAKLILITNSKFDLERGAVRSQWRSRIEEANPQSPSEEERVVGELVAAYWAGLIQQEGISPASVLVISLDGDRDDGWVLEEAFKRVLGARAHDVARWDPQLDN